MVGVVSLSAKVLDSFLFLFRSKAVVSAAIASSLLFLSSEIVLMHICWVLSPCLICDQSSSIYFPFFSLLL